MRIRSFLAGLALASMGSSLVATAASATMLINEDRGGQIGNYLRAFAVVRSSGEKVVIDGNCLSACTLVLGLVPRERVCVTRRARLGFHAAWMPDAYGRPITSPMGTQALWDLYPQRVRNWIDRNGGLSRKMIYMQGRDLAAMVPICDTPSTSYSADASPRRVTADAAHSERASASRQRH